MADKTEIEVTIAPDGKVTIVTHGLSGQACLTETEALEKAIGKVLKRDNTSELYQAVGKVTGKVRGR